MIETNMENLETLDGADSSGRDPVHTGSDPVADGVRGSVEQFDDVIASVKRRLAGTEVLLQLNGGEDGKDGLDEEIALGVTENGGKRRGLGAGGDSLEVKESGVVKKGGSKGDTVGCVFDLNEEEKDGGEEDDGVFVKEIPISGEDVSVKEVPILGDDVVVVNGGLSGVFEVTVEVADVGEAENPTLGGDEVKEGKDGVFENGGNRDNTVKEKGVSRNGASETGGEGEEVSEDGKQGEKVEEAGGDTKDGFCVGDFVWVKVKSHPWWPGQIYDSSDASAEAAKYQKKDRLLVACFGDGTFAWCNASQLKPFQENFDQLVKQGNSKIFVNAVEQAVEEIGRCIEVEMMCSCVKVGDTNRLVVPLAVNAGVKEGVAVPEGRIGELSISQFDPTKFLARLKDISQAFSVDNMLELNVIKSRLSSFYSAKGYNQLPMYCEPLNIVDPESDAGKGIIVDINVSAEEDWLSSPVGPWHHKISSGLGGRSPEISQFKLYHRKKQRSMTDLMGGEMDDEPDEDGETLVDDDEAGDTVVAEETTGSGKPSSMLRRRKQKKDSGIKNGSDVAEELTVSGRRTTALRKTSRNADVEFRSGGAEELTVHDKTPMLRKRNTRMESEFGGDGGVTEELTVPGKGTASLKKRNRKVDSEVLNDNNGPEELVVSGNRKRGPRSRNKAKDSEPGSDSVAGELTLSGNRTRASKKRNTTEDSKIGNISDVAEESISCNTSKDINLSGRGTRALRKRSKTNYSETGSESDAAEDLIVFGEIGKKTKGGKVDEGGNVSDVAETAAVLGNTNRYLILSDSGARELRKRTKTNYSETTGNESDAAEELTVSGEVGKKTKGGEVDEGYMPEEASGVSRKRVRSKGDKNSKLPGSPHATAEGNASKDEKDDVGSNEGSKSGISLRERKKSKYLSPPYTNLTMGSRILLAFGNTESESLDSPKISQRADSAGRDFAHLGLRKCSGEALQKNLSEQGKTAIEDYSSSINEMLTDIRSVAMEPLCLMEKKTYTTIKGFFMRFRESVYHGGSDFVTYSKYLAGRGSRKRVSFKVDLPSPGKDFHDADSPTSPGKSEQKKSKMKEGEISSTTKKSKQALASSDVKINHSGEAGEKSSGAALLLTFAPGATLPSKDQLIKTCEQFGAVEESETEVLEDSNCAQVVFAKKSDAQAAYNNSAKISPFGSAVMSYRLRFLPASPRAINKGLSEVPAAEVSDILSLRQSLEMTTSVLEKSWDKMSLEVKADLEAEVKSLLNKVTSAVGS